MTARRHREDHQGMVTVWNGAAKCAAFAILMVNVGGRSLPPGHSRVACRCRGCIGTDRKAAQHSRRASHGRDRCPRCCCRCTNK
jgi:hypothetical protein